MPAGQFCFLIYFSFIAFRWDSAWFSYFTSGTAILCWAIFAPRFTAEFYVENIQVIFSCVWNTESWWLIIEFSLVKSVFMYLSHSSCSKLICHSQIRCHCRNYLRIFEKPENSKWQMTNDESNSWMTQTPVTFSVTFIIFHAVNDNFVISKPQIKTVPFNFILNALNQKKEVLYSCFFLLWLQLQCHFQKYLYFPQINFQLTSSVSETSFLLLFTSRLCGINLSRASSHVAPAKKY